MSRLLSFCLTILFAIQAAGNEPLKAQKIDQPLLIDGKLDEKSWDSAIPINDFRINGNPDKKATYPTSAKILYDDNCIYFGIRCEEPEISSLKMQNGKRDSNNVYWSDCVDIMLDPGASGDTYYHFIVSADGKVFDKVALQGGVLGDSAWDCKTKEAAYVGDGFWSCEIAIPFYALNIKPDTKQMWALNICREKKNPPENSSIAGGAFNAASVFLKLEIPDADLSRYCYFLSVPEFAFMVDGKKMKTDISFNVKNQTGRKNNVLCVCTLESPSGKIYGKSVEKLLEDKKPKTVNDFHFEVEEQGCYTCSIMICDAVTKKPYSIKTVKQKIEFVPLKIRVEEPFSRNIILSSQQLKDVVLNISLSNTPEELKNLTLQVCVSDQTTLKNIKEFKIDNPEKENKLILKTESLPYGTLEIKAILKNNKDGGKYAETSESIVKALPSGNEWWIDNNLNIRHNGEIFLGYGWYSGGNAEKPENNNVNMNYGQAYLLAGDVAAAVSKLLKMGIYSIVEPDHKSMYRKNIKRPLSSEEENLLRERIRELKNMPGLLGYYIGEEPDGCGVLPERLERIYQICREEDPHHLSFGVFAYADRIAPYVNTCDVIMVDPYPRFLEAAPPAIPISMVSAYMQKCREIAAKNRKSFWHVPQAFDFSSMYKNARNPNFTELRNQVLQGIIEGGKGILWFTYRYRWNCPDINIGIPFLGKEISLLKNAIAAQEEKNGILKWNAAENNEIHASIKHSAGFTYIFAVNTSRNAQENVKFIVTELKDCELFVVSEKRKLKISDGTFSDNFSMYEGHIYTDDPSFANTETISSVQGKIDGAWKSAVKSGNIAHRSLGCDIKVSSFKAYASPHAPERYINDGFTGLTWGPTDADAKKCLELDFHKDVEVARIVIYGRPGDFEIMAKNGNGWNKVYRGKGMAGENITTASFPVQKTNGIKIVFKSGDIAVKEIEAYSN